MAKDYKNFRELQSEQENYNRIGVDKERSRNDYNSNHQKRKMTKKT